MPTLIFSKFICVVKQYLVTFEKIINKKKQPIIENYFLELPLIIL